MNGITGWDYHPYVPYNEIYRKGEPYISMLAPPKTPSHSSGKAARGERRKSFYRKRGEGEFKEQNIDASRIELTSLEQGAEYEFYVQDKLGRKSSVRL